MYADASGTRRPIAAISERDDVLNLPILRWGKPYDSLEVDQVLHFMTGEPIAKVSQANGGLLERDMRFAQRARDVLRELPAEDLIARVKKAADLYLNGTLPRGTGAKPRGICPPQWPRPACPSTCAGATCRRTTSC